jgi:hypothetical protein
MRFVLGWMRPAVSTNVSPLGHERLRGVEDDGRRIGPVRALDDRNVQLLAPKGQLFLGRGPERIGGREDDPAPLPLVSGGQLGRGRGLAAAVDADHQDDHRPVSGRRCPLPGREQGDDLVLEGPLQLGLVPVLSRLRPEGFEDSVRGGDADVGEDERLFELLQDLVAALAAAEEVLDLAEGVPGPGQLFPEASEHGLNILFFNRLIVNGGG